MDRNFRPSADTPINDSSGPSGEVLAITGTFAVVEVLLAYLFLILFVRNVYQPLTVTACTITTYAS